VPALLAERPLRVSRIAASVVSIPVGIDLLLLMLPAAKTEATGVLNPGLRPGSEIVWSFRLGEASA